MLVAKLLSDLVILPNSIQQTWRLLSFHFKSVINCIYEYE
jgi:hypothetical protein